MVLRAKEEHMNTDAYPTYTVRNHLVDPKIRPVTLPLCIHPNKKSGAVVLIYPGARGNMHGHNDKYAKIAQDIVARDIGAVVRMNNYTCEGERYADTMMANITAVYDYIRLHQELICGAPLQLYLMGFSAGGGACAAFAARVGATVAPKLLLLAPAWNVREAEHTFAAYKGDVFIAVGDKDEVTGVHSADLFFEHAKSAASRTLTIVPDCDHQFRGETCGKIFSKAPRWAFAGDTSFPSPEGGIVLYR
jgi:dienelactone hydrolase